MKYLTSIVVLIASAALLLPEPTAPLRAPARTLAASGQGQSDGGLDVSGGNPKIVKVKRVIEVFDDRTVYTAFPISVKAPAGFGYSWTVPANVVANRKGSVLEIVSGSKGPATIGVTYYVVDFKKEKVDEVFAERTIDIGDVIVPDPKPDPTPKPPVIVASKVVVVVCEESLASTVLQRKAISDPVLRKFFVDGGHKFKVLDVSDPAYLAQGYKPFVDKVGLPAALVFDAAIAGPQIPLTAIKIPDSGAELLAEIRKVVK